MVWTYLYEKGLPVNFEMKLTIKVIEGKSYNSLDIQLPKRKLSKEEYDKITKSALLTTKKDGYKVWSNINPDYSTD